MINKYKFEALILGIRRDEEGSRSKERFFSLRNEDLEWDYTNQPPEFWNQFNTDFPKGSHVRVHPLLSWTEIDIWMYIKRENIPVIDLYFAKNGKRYRSLGCAPCTFPVESNATTIDEIIEELKHQGKRKSRTSSRPRRCLCNAKIEKRRIHVMLCTRRYLKL